MGLLVLPSCIVVHSMATPALDGVVLSAATRNAVPNASVSHSDPRDKVMAKTVTREDGSFSLPATYRWELEPLYGDHVNGSTIVVEHPAFKKSPPTFVNGPIIRLSEPILLEPLR